MSYIELIIQSLGILAFCILVLSYTRKTPTLILLYQCVSNSIYALHYFLLGALPGALISFVGLFRNIAIMKVKKHREIVVIVVISIYALITMIFYEGISSIFPMIANSCYLLTMVKDTRESLLIGGLISSSLWCTYSFVVGSYAGMITEFIVFVTNIIHLINIKRDK